MALHAFTRLKTESVTRLYLGDLSVSPTFKMVSFSPLKCHGSILFNFNLLLLGEKKKKLN